MGDTTSGATPHVSIGLPVRNGERHLVQAVRSVLGQSYEAIELVISDNASVDGTEEICRELARSDPRIRYHRQPHDIGPVANFGVVLRQARGTYFRWIGDDDWLTPTYVARCVAVLEEDPGLILVTTQQGHVGPDGTVLTARFDAGRLRSARAVDRFAEMLRLLNESPLLLDPLYGMLRRERVVRLPRPTMLFEDQVLAARLALAGPFGHVAEILSYRRTSPYPRPAVTATRLGVPRWQARVATTLQCRELLRAVREADLGPGDRRRAQRAVARMFVRRHRVTAARRSRRLVALLPRAAGRPVAPLFRFSASSGTLQ